MIEGAETSTDQSNSSSQKENESEVDSALDSTVGNTPKEIIVSNFNLDLLPGVHQDFRNVDWYKVSATTFFIGVYVVLIWAFLIFSALIVDYLIKAPTGVTVMTRLLTVIPIMFPMLGVFGIVARWSWRRMEDTPPPSNSVIGQFKHLSIGSSSTLFIISLLSIVLALTFRAVIHSVSVSLYGSGLSPSQVLSIAILDGIYIGLLLIGFGGLTSLLFTDE